MHKTDCDVNLGLDPNSIDSVLPKCRESLLSTSHSLTISKKVSEYDQEIPQSQTADNPVASRGRAAQPSRDTKKTK